jgi:hypothetical protein
VNLARLSACQADAIAGQYAAALAGFVAWLTPRYGEIVQRFDAERIEQRNRFVGRFPHARTPDMVANLLLGLLYLLDFAEHAGAISADEHERLWQRGQAAFLKVANRQKDRHSAFDPAARFPVLFSTLLTSGRAHVAGRDGAEPKPAHESGPWGYELRDGQWRGRGRKIGWLDGDEVLLDPDAVYAELTRLTAEQGQVFPVTATTLWRRLKEAQILIRFDPERTTYRETVEGTRQAVLILAASSLRETVPTVPTVPKA